MKRIYEAIIRLHLAENQQMLFLAGPRQVGKSTLCLAAKQFTDRFLYLNWDNSDHRKIILLGEKEIIPLLQLDFLSNHKPIIVFDEIHKFRDWKNYLKGFYDIYKDRVHIIVSGSAKLDIYQRGGDSLMGRYLLYRVHPLSLAEVVNPNINWELIRPPQQSPNEFLPQLLLQGGYPEPFIKNNIRFSNQWRNLRFQQLFREDIQSLKKILNIDQLELLAEALCEQATGLLNYSNLAKDIRVSVDTIKRWISVLSLFYYCFRLRPWHKNVKRSLIKEPKIFLWDWALVRDEGARLENMVACHLLKAVHLWTDLGMGKFALYYLRDKDKNEVDLLVTKNNKPWFIVEVKTSANKPISKNLAYYQEQTQSEYAFEVIYDLPYSDINCFSRRSPVRVPMSTFLSQLC